MTRIVQATEDSIKGAAALLREGALVALPTETVYGLGANALDGSAVARIFEAKGRPSFNPLIAHFHSLEQIEAFAEINDQVKVAAMAFWPGPLTMILPRKESSGISELATAGLETIAVRVPDHPVALDLLKNVDFPIVAPSANKSGALSPTTPAHVADGLGGAVDMVLAAGACRIGLESTVLDLSGDAPVILRPGAITEEELSDVLFMDVPYAVDIEDDPEAPKSPGMLLKHYAPETPVRLNAIDLQPGEALLAFGSDKFMGIKGGGAAKDLPDAQRLNLSQESDLHEAAANLFAMLKELDKSEYTAIAVMAVPETGLGIAINDRLRRAAEAG